MSRHVIEIEGIRIIITAEKIVEDKPKKELPVPATHSDNSLFSEYLTFKQFAELIRIQPASLERRYTTGTRGSTLPPVYMIDSKRYYKREEVQEWFDRQTNPLRREHESANDF
jgi:hypothetical protein